MAVSKPTDEKLDLGKILEKARKRALRGGIPGMAAMATQGEFRAIDFPCCWCDGNTLDWDGKIAI